MFKFRDYPIYVIHSRNWQKKVEPIRLQIKAELAFLTRALKKNLLNPKRYRDSSVFTTVWKINEQDKLLAATKAWELEEDVNPKYKSEIKNYERQVSEVLTAISNTRIGQILLNSFNKASKIYIVPLYDYHHKYVALTTGPYLEIEGGGIRIEYNPDEFSKVSHGSNIGYDDRRFVLFHELTHATRLSNNRAYLALLGDSYFINIEEFAATQFENIYRSTVNRSSLVSIYNGGFVSKETGYEVLIDNRRFILALRDLLRFEPMARAAAHLMEPTYNPFRDYKFLEDASNRLFNTGGFIDL